MLNCIRGYKLSFNSRIFQNKVPNVRFDSVREEKCCNDAIEKLLAKGAIVKCEPVERRFLSSFFLVPKPDGSYRFILSLKELNKCIHTDHFKMEDIRSAAKLIFPNCFMATLDLEDAYLLVPVHKSSQKYLRFVFQNTLYQFVALPFGLNLSPFIFIKIMSPY